MNPHGTRTQQALAWMESAPVGETRTQLEAAARFGIAQPTIAAAVARRRQSCPSCGQRVKPVAGRRATAVDPRLVQLARAVGVYAWHVADCPGYDGAGACTCGFDQVERIAGEVGE